ncbi:sigma factor-like helix-turn-helix DNA-binding protein [Acidicapsa ligni]|uniref:sigma factor-like helix-turn-helix DNA-binding protein n=1 Tax=Acidicapsa ligni TaxID=542300 RepID=UPI0021E045FB|nr:sigma factor-like helix-turn-helix DNA-binding protein [Acidicapsa ligni]
MSAALQLPILQLPALRVAKVWATVDGSQRPPIANAVRMIREQATKPAHPSEAETEPCVTYAFYRKHTENLLRRYLYASMQVGRSPSLLGESVGRGWVSSRRVRTFEDAVIFVLDVERCLKKLSPLDRQMITRLVLQEYTQPEAASLLGISARTICTKFPKALDRLTEALVQSELLVLPD